MKFGIDRLVADAALRRPLAGKRVALVAHPASVTQGLVHSLDALTQCGDMKVTAAFGPQHGMRGDKQDNMVESPDFDDPASASRLQPLRRGAPPDRPDDGHVRHVLIDLQDLGCRIYTFITTLLYMLEAGRDTASPCGCSTAQTRPAGPSKA
jgi:uncharacterized protein YbbC (DUF1343 family)